MLSQRAKSECPESKPAVHRKAGRLLVESGMNGDSLEAFLTATLAGRLGADRAVELFRVCIR